MSIKWRLGKSHNSPGTQQLCVLCNEPTGRCEENSIFFIMSERGFDDSTSYEDVGPLCEDCLDREIETDRLLRQ
jgi:hypothetical protein